MAQAINTSQTTFNEFYGEMPTTIWRKVKRFNIPPAEYDMMLMLFGEVVTDWDAMAQFINDNVNPKNGMFYFPMGVL